MRVYCGELSDRKTNNDCIWLAFKQNVCRAFWQSANCAASAQAEELELEGRQFECVSADT